MKLKTRFSQRATAKREILAQEKKQGEYTLLFLLHHKTPNIKWRFISQTPC
jgi:hypothetical protein